MTSRSRTRIAATSPLVGSAIVNIIAWWAFLASISVLRAGQDGMPEAIVVSSSRVRVERSAARAPVPAEPAGPATLALSPRWSKQDAGNMAASDAAVWLNWSKQSKNFVPRVIVADLRASAGYMHGGSLRAAVRDRLDGLRAGAAAVSTSTPLRVCHGTRPGWFFSYAKLWDDPPLRFDEALYVAHGTIYMAVYMHPADQPEDPHARDALTSLCSSSF